MKRFFGYILVAVATVFLVACFGSGGSSAPAPNNVVVAAKDSRVVVTWDMMSGVTYWIFRAAAAGVTPTTCSSLPLCVTTMNAFSPTTVTGLANGQTYSFSINGRNNGGPGGPGSPAVIATPRLAGNTWSSGLTLSNNLRGVTYGGMYVAVGDGGSSFSSTDAITWTALTNLPVTTFYAVSYDSVHAKYLSVGAGGMVGALTPTTSSTIWTSQIISPVNDLYSIANNGVGVSVATGASGTIFLSSDGLSWSPQASGTPNHLYGVTYGPTATGNIFVAVGQAGKIIYSTDGITWNSATAGTDTFDLKSVVYGAGVFVAVGTNGTVLTSADGAAWAPQSATSIPTSSLLNSVTYSVGRRFIAVSNTGQIFYSEYSSVGAAWTQVTQASPVIPTATPIYSITTGGLYDYTAVGSAGLNLYSD